MTYFIGGTVTVGVAVLGVAYDYMRDWLGHHPGDYPKTFGNVEVIIREQATNWNAHKIKLTILWSPENKANGFSAEKHTWHASSSRNECLKELEKKVHGVYAQK